METKLETKSKPPKLISPRLLFLTGALAVLVVLFITLKREQINQDMIQGVQMSEPEKVDSSLKWGADPNRLVGRYNVRAKSFMELIDAVLHPEKNPSTTKPILVIACGLGNTEAVEILLKHGADKNYIMTDGQTALHSAAKRSTSETIKVLIRYRANSNIKDKLGRTPLHIAANNENSACVEALLESGAKIDARDNANYTPLMTAIAKGKSKNVLAFLKHGAGLDDFNYNKYKSQPVGSAMPRNPNMGSAIYQGAAAIMTASGSSSYSAPNGLPFYWAASVGDLALMKYLYEEKMTPGEKKNIGGGDLMTAAMTRKIETVDYILHLGVDINANVGGGAPLLAMTISNRDFAMAHLLISRGVRVNGLTQNGETPLIEVAKQVDQMNFVVYVPQGAINSQFISIQDGNKRYSLIAEANNQNRQSAALDREPMHKLIKELILKGADVNAMNTLGERPLKFALSDSELVKLFLEKGANPNPPMPHGDSYLMHPANMSSETTERLILAGVNVNGKTDLRATPLMQAVTFFNPEAARVLLKHGADPNAVDSAGKTALYYAAQNGYAPLLKLLKDAGATQ